jgi:hypothetical protein
VSRDLFGQSKTQERVAAIVNGIDLDMVLHHETQTDHEKLGAVLVSDDGTEARAVWLPKKSIEIQRSHSNDTARGTRRSGQIVRLPVITVTVPERLAREKGLI